MALLHARATNTLVHAYGNAGEVNLIITQHNLVDENGNQFVDESGNNYVVLVEEAVPVLHAGRTDTLIHAG